MYNHWIINIISLFFISFLLLSCLENKQSEKILTNGKDSTKVNSPKFNMSRKDSTKTNIDTNRLAIKDSTAQEKPKGQGKIIYKKLENDVVIGDFDGDGIRDTLIQKILDKNSKKEILFFPDPFQNEWETVVKFFYRKSADVILYISNSNLDTLHLGIAMGLYCLLNVGDTNNDGKEEIALVIDQLDYSMVNSCGIYSLCGEQWRLLNSFSIHESAFFFTSKEIPRFTHIKGFLEKKGKVWKYIGYNENYPYARPEDVGKLRILKVKSCN